MTFGKCTGTIPVSEQFAEGCVGDRRRVKSSRHREFREGAGLGSSQPWEGVLSPGALEGAPICLQEFARRGATAEEILVRADPAP